MDPDASVPTDSEPSVFNYVLSFLLVGVAWGFTTPFIRRAAADFNARQEKQAGGNPASPRGRSQNQSPAQSSLSLVEEEQVLLVEDDQEEEEGVRRRSGSQQRQDDSARAAEQLNVELDADLEVDDTPTPAWRRSSSQSWLRTKIVALFWTVVNLLRTPAYSIPLVINISGWPDLRRR